MWYLYDLQALEDVMREMKDTLDKELSDHNERIMMLETNKMELQVTTQYEHTLLPNNTYSHSLHTVYTHTLTETQSPLFFIGT